MEMNGRIVVPKDIRKAVGAKLGTKFIWEMMDDGSVRVTAKARRFKAPEEARSEVGDSENGVDDA
jgi:bifunctional DNA-binding transcriptional regulator/antitoxin component of YhaV-PrlF toxin-antitoxin module